MTGDHLGRKYIQIALPGCSHWAPSAAAKVTDTTAFKDGHEAKTLDVPYCRLGMPPVTCAGFAVMCSSLALLQTTLSSRGTWLMEPRLDWVLLQRRQELWVYGLFSREERFKRWENSFTHEPMILKNVQYWLKLSSRNADYYNGRALG